MSFSSDVKEELSKLSNLANKETVKYELLGYFSTNHVALEKNKIKFATESQYNINRFGKLISNTQVGENYAIEVNGKNFCITLNKLALPELEYIPNAIILNQEVINKKMQNNENLEKAYVRGGFLGGGSINNPKSNYHLEILFSNQANAIMVQNILQKYQVSFKILKKKNNYSLYTKDGEVLSKFLAFIQANQSVLKFEEIRVLRDIRNNVNRKVNCETANLNKTVDAAVKQIKAISYLQEIGELKNLSPSLRQIAILRLENPEASLLELGQMLEKPIGKSGVNHRLKTIEKIAQEKRV